MGGRALNEDGSQDTVLNQTSNTHELKSGSQTMGAKVHQSKGKQPTSQFKVPKSMLSVKGGVVTTTVRRLA